MTHGNSEAETGKQSIQAETSIARQADGVPVKGVPPALTLALLAPVVAEVLSGATRISYIFALAPEIMVWGCCALIIREIVRRRHLPWTSMLLMGLGLSIAEEFVIQQTSLAPLPWLGSAPIYGRALGVNWLYFLFMLGYESVWVVMVPVHLTELIFWRRREQPWLRTPGLIISASVFVLGSYVAWYAWVKRARPMVFHAPAYQPPLVTILLGVLAIAVLVGIALSLREQSGPSAKRPPSPWVVSLFVLVAGFAWYVPIGLVFNPTSSLRALPFWIPMLAGVAWAGAVFALFRRWSHSTNWNTWHHYAAIFAAILVCMIAGFLGSSAWPRKDLAGKCILDIIAVLLLIVLARPLQRLTGDRQARTEESRVA
jgi:hypothetical protein